jgi:RHS repeat-associated protein
VTNRTGSTNTPFLLHGALGVMSDSNGLAYMRARYYNPRLMRFCNADPIGFAGGMNAYAFGGNNPMGVVDPSGLCGQGSGSQDPIYELPPLVVTATRIGFFDTVDNSDAVAAAYARYQQAWNAGNYFTAASDYLRYLNTPSKRNAAFDFFAYGLSIAMMADGGGLGGPMTINPSEVPVFRGGASLEVKPFEIRLDPDTGLVMPTRGPSLNLNPSAVKQFGGAYQIKSIPLGLQIIQRGQNLSHFEIVPQKLNLSPPEFQQLLNQVEFH